MAEGGWARAVRCRTPGPRVGPVFCRFHCQCGESRGRRGRRRPRDLNRGGTLTSPYGLAVTYGAPAAPPAPPVPPVPPLPAPPAVCASRAAAAGTALAAGAAGAAGAAVPAAWCAGCRRAASADMPP